MTLISDTVEREIHAPDCYFIGCKLGDNKMHLDLLPATPFDQSERAISKKHDRKQAFLYLNSVIGP